MKLHDTTGFASGHQFLEGLRWHDGALWASDFFSREVLTFATDGTATTVAEIAGMPSGLGFLADGSTLVVSQADATVRRIAPDGTLSTHADFGHIAGGPGNDMLVTAAGHAYVGNFGFDLMGGAELRYTTLTRVDPDGTVTIVAEDLGFPNGMVILPGGGWWSPRRSPGG